MTFSCPYLVAYDSGVRLILSFSLHVGAFVEQQLDNGLMPLRGGPIPLPKSKVWPGIEAQDLELLIRRSD